MESPVLTLVVALCFAVNVDSQRDVIPPPPPSPLPEPPPPVSRPPPSTPHWVLRPPPLTPSQPLPPTRASFPPPRPLKLPPPPRKHLQPALPAYDSQDSNKKLSPPLERQKPNIGKKIGLMFIGVATILQFCILAFLLIRRRQLLRSEHGY